MFIHSTPLPPAQLPMGTDPHMMPTSSPSSIWISRHRVLPALTKEFLPPSSLSSAMALSRTR